MVIGMDEKRMEETLDYFEEKKEDKEEDNFYSRDFINKLVEDDEMTAGEEGFMIGYMEA
jgi:hypothetical protein